MNERQIAISVLMEISEKNAYNNIALRRALDAHPNSKQMQRAFVTELVNGTLRNRILIDHVINSFSRNPTSDMKPFITELLRTAVYQIMFMSKVPPSAAVNEAVKLAKRNGFEPLSGFVNGILRNIVRAGDIKPWDSVPGKVQRTFPPAGDLSPDPVYLSIRYSFPLWLARALQDWLGDGAEKFCADSHIAPAVTVCVNTLKTNRDALAAELEATGIICTASETTDTCLHLRRVSNLTATDAYKKGHFFVIDENAYLAALALRPAPGQTIIDLCAAPGGKSFALAGLMQNEGKIISCDIHPHKIRLLEKMASRLSISCIQAEVRDALVPNPDWQADAVLLDAPCTGFGIIQKKPDIKYTKTMKDVKELAKFQRALLTAAATYVKHGGTLVYSTCTVTTEENEDNTAWFLENHPYELLTQERIGGFFIARMVRK